MSYPISNPSPKYIEIRTEGPFPDCHTLDLVSLLAKSIFPNYKDKENIPPKTPPNSPRK